MAFLVRPYRRFPLCCSVTYSLGLCKGHGIVWNFSLSGWRLSGDLPLRVGETCSLLFTYRTNPFGSSRGEADVCATLEICGTVGSANRRSLSDEHSP
jgi:hypothetical protein